MTRLKMLTLILLTTLALAACGDDDGGTNNTSNDSNGVDAGDVVEDTTHGNDTNGGEEDTEIDTAPREVYWADVSAVFEDRNCSGCHGNIPDSYESVVDEWIETSQGNVLKEKMEINHRVNDEDAQVVLDWIENGYPKE